MTAGLTEDEALAIGRQAKAELTQTESTFLGVERELIEEWLRTKIEDVAKREKLFLAIRGLRSVKSIMLRAAQEVDAADLRNIIAAESDFYRPT